MSETDDVIQLRARDLKAQMEAGAGMFSQWMETFMAAGQLKMDPLKLKSLRLASASLAEQFTIIAESAGRTAEVMLDGDE